MNSSRTRRSRRRREVIDVLARARPRSLDAYPGRRGGWPDAADLIAAAELTEPGGDSERDIEPLGLGARPRFGDRPRFGARPRRGGRRIRERRLARDGGSRPGLAAGRRLLAAMLSAAATAAVIALVLAGAPGPVAPGPGRTPVVRTPRTARAALLYSAAHVIHSPAAGTYWELKQVTGTVSAGGTRAHPYDITTRLLEDQGLSPIRGHREWSFGETLGATPWTATDYAQWRAAGSPTQWIFGSGTATTQSYVGRTFWQPSNGIMGWVEGELPWWTSRQFQALPASTSGLRHVLAHLAVKFIALAGPGSALTANSLIWQGATQILQNPVTWQVRAAALRVMAGFAGLRSLGWMRDPLGRRGIGIYAGPPSGLGTAPTSWPEIVVIDPANGSLLAVENLATPGGLTPGPIPSGSLYHGRPCLGGHPVPQPLGLAHVVRHQNRLICLPVYFHRRYPMQVKFWQAVLSAGWTDSVPKQAVSGTG